MSQFGERNSLIPITNQVIPAFKLFIGKTDFYSSMASDLITLQLLIRTWLIAPVHQQ